MRQALGGTPGVVRPECLPTRNSPRPDSEDAWQVAQFAATNAALAPTSAAGPVWGFADGPFRNFATQFGCDRPAEDSLANVALQRAERLRIYV
ncbi:hypothetical protein OG738_27220 [Amycolatopsis sp. NBC_01488]|uniref:hypothetical protein n=1 Tax=Amycolatopsis sp. NBC_01488 TaxID=2903563 RepID=UPI002E29C395|nr:hypothetical protein [Amycolatopsis sp. NBC_01488]